MNSVRFSYAAQVAFILVSADLCLNKGDKVLGIALGLLGQFIVRTSDERYQAWKQRRFRVLAPLEVEYDCVLVKKIVNQIAKRYPVVFLNYIRQFGLFKEDEILPHFIQKIKKGICYGILASIFKSSKIFNEKAIYFQILQSIRVHVGEIEEKQIEMRKIKDEDPFYRLHSSPIFFAHDSCSTYESVFEIAVSNAAFSKSKFFCGILHIPRHVLGFESGAKGYYLYDSLNETKGLFVYPCKKTFFSSLRDLVLSDISLMKLGSPAEVFFQFCAVRKPFLSGINIE